MSDGSPDDESEAEKLDRDLIELLHELRVTGTGIQVLFGFLLVVPFNAGYRRLTEFEKVIYFAGLLCIAAAAVLLIAPSVHHRLLFRRHERAFIVRTANAMVVVAMAFLAVGLTLVRDPAGTARGGLRHRAPPRISCRASSTG
jgi:hypothetical protein